MSTSANSGIQRIKNYAFLYDDMLGEGSTGKVYMGLNEHTKEKVAIKVIDMKEIDNEVTNYLLDCEKEALSTISHPNVLHAFDIIQEQKFCYIITQLCPNGTLKEYIRSKKYLPEQEALKIFTKLIQGYQAIKQKRFVHRDIKSANVLLRNGEPIIIDFGYCQKTYGTKPSIFYNVGSPSYMSPEAYYRTMYSEKSDIWALGIILFQMLEGHTIDYGQDINKYFKGLIKNSFFLQKPVSQGCLRLLKMCLEINPGNRIDSQSIIHKLRDFSFHQNMPNSSPQPSRKLSIKQYKSKAIQQQFNNSNQLQPEPNRNSPQQFHPTNQQVSIPLTQSILRKPVSASFIQQSQRMNQQQRASGFEGPANIPVTPNIRYNQNIRSPLQRLSNAQSVVSSTSYQTDRINLKEHHNRVQETRKMQFTQQITPPFLQSKHLSPSSNSLTRNNTHKFMAQSLNLVDQMEIEPNEPPRNDQRGVNIVVPNREKKHSIIHHSVILDERNLPNHILNSNANFNFAPNRSSELNPRQVSYPQPYMQLQPMRVKSSCILPQDQPFKNISVVKSNIFPNQPYPPHSSANNGQPFQKNPHNQMMTQAHQAFVKKSVPFFQQKSPQIHFAKPICPHSNPNIAELPRNNQQKLNFNGPMPSNMIKNSIRIPIERPQNSTFPQNNRCSGLPQNSPCQNSPPQRNSNNFQGPFRGPPPQMQQTQPVYVLNQQNNRNFTVQPFTPNRPQVQSFFK